MLSPFFGDPCAICITLKLPRWDLISLDRSTNVPGHQQKNVSFLEMAVFSNKQKPVPHVSGVCFVEIKLYYNISISLFGEDDPT